MKYEPLQHSPGDDESASNNSESPELLDEAIHRALRDGWTLRTVKPSLPVILCPPSLPHHSSSNNNSPRRSSSTSAMPSVALARVKLFRGRPTLLINDFYKVYLPPRQIPLLKTLLPISGGGGGKIVK